MNDLNGLDWSSKPATGHKPGQGNYSSFSSLKPTPPPSGRASPLAGNVPQAVPFKTSTPVNDSFASLVAFSGSNGNKNLSLQEQQRLREQSKVQQLVDKKAQLQSQWAVGDDLWNNLGSGRSTPAQNNVTAETSKKAEEEDDLFAAFNKPASTSNNTFPTRAAETAPGPEDDDPFGLSELKVRPTAPSELTESLMGDEDDVLGDLGKPVQPKLAPAPRPPQRRISPRPSATSDHPQDKAVAELVDMGFPAEKAKRALEATDTGTNVQAAVGILLNQAHEEARQKTRGREASQLHDRSDEQVADRDRLRQPHPDARQRAKSPALSNDPAKAAQELGTAFIKSAGSFWKTAQKQVQQVVKDFNSDAESGTSTPKWMQETAAPSRSRPVEQRQRPGKAVPQPPNVTDEAMMLESERPTPPPQQRSVRSRPDVVFDAGADSSRDHSPAVPSRLRDSTSPQPAFMRPQQQDPLASMMRPKPQQGPRSARDVLNKQSAEDQASQAYTSCARRRKPATPAAAQTQEADLLEGTSSQPAQSFPARPATKSAPPQVQRASKPTTPIQIRPPPPTRHIPPISAIALKATNTARAAGNAHFKRGDYSAAHESYNTSLRHIPTSHPLQIVLLTNRALTALKTGQPKVAIADSDQTITLIGISKGESETIEVTDDNSTTSAKPMRDYYGKALMRKAEGLENLEKWAEAAAVWQLCVQDGHGGATAIQGRARAEKAATPKPAVAPAARRPPQRAPRPAVSAKPAAAVNALRAQNEAAEKLDDEKFALADSVTASVNRWKGGKETNLRALLASLDSVLWEGSGWKKIGMADLVLPNKVKIHYMKGIGKCHPDKIPGDATTEQRMIAASVFSTLNEAWDKFKAENNL